jgi:hypothetical protein
MAFRSSQQSHCSRFAAFVAVCSTLIALTGCAFNGNFLAILSADRQQPCVLPANSNVQQVVQKLNSNITPLHGWRSTDVKIVPHGQGAIIGLRLSARIAVEQPHNFRLMVTALSNPEADLGSNDERSWFWMRRGPPNVITVRHADIGRVRSLPFDPQWVTEVLGVVAFNENDLKMDPPKEKRGPIRLVADHALPDGRNVQRAIVVDGCSGHINSHELYNSSNQLIARADLSDYRPEAGLGIELPHQIRLDWPLFGFGLTMTIGNIETNPSGIAASVWEMPRPPGYPVLDLANMQKAPQRTAQATPPGTATDGQAPAFRDDVGDANGDKSGGPIRQMSGETGWVPPTVRDDRRPRPTGSNQPLDAAPKRRTWWQRMTGR